MAEGNKKQRPLLGPRNPARSAVKAYLDRGIRVHQDALQGYADVGGDNGVTGDRLRAQIDMLQSVRSVLIGEMLLEV